MTLLLTRRDVADLLTIDDCIDAVENAFRLLGLGQVPRPAIAGVHADGGGFHVKAAIVGNRFAVKVNGNFPGNPERHGLPTIQGLIILADAERGTPLAVLDSISITAMRTAAASAVAAKYLAVKNARTIMTRTRRKSALDSARWASTSFPSNNMIARTRSSSAAVTPSAC